ncbi:serine/threonine-protein kinase NIM1-like [Protopterus annectens]|uniref:serine/threonine-protein kinase NIM1-like n=1 Tax=Protopterus annectens TaxID=7888 RepID=UPI001CFADF83|nr:serine/threonine-protein kinase NIM1-like [Protopterus annectens]
MTVWSDNESMVTTWNAKDHKCNAEAMGESKNCNTGLIEKEEKEQNTKMTPFEREVYSMLNEDKLVTEIICGKRIGFYQFRGKIGSGNFAHVRLGIHTLTKEKVAIKILEKAHLDQQKQDFLKHEILSMESLHHPNIIRLYEVVETPKRLHLVMEYAAGGDLFTKLGTYGRMSENEGKFTFAQVVSALKHMHDNNIVHRDIKAENIFYSSRYCVKLGDFGFSTFCYPSEPLKTLCGSPPYAAPELFRNEKYIGMYVDVWALGILLYFMITATMPFKADTFGRLKCCILQGSYSIPSYVSEPCQKLIQGMLRIVPVDRSILTQIMNCTWLKGIEFPNAYSGFRLTPSWLADSAPMNQQENEVKKSLINLGITEEHIRNNPCQDSRSAITGTYRILLGRVIKRYFTEGITNTRICDQQRGQGKHKKQVSVACTIL